jgi:hypothetical protein
VEYDGQDGSGSGWWWECWPSIIATIFYVSRKNLRRMKHFEKKFIKFCVIFCKVGIVSNGYEQKLNSLHLDSHCSLWNKKLAQIHRVVSEMKHAIRYMDTHDLPIMRYFMRFLQRRHKSASQCVFSIISGYLSPRQGSYLHCGWRRRPPYMKGRWNNSNRQPTRGGPPDCGLSADKQTITVKIHHSTKYYAEPRTWYHWTAPNKGKLIWDLEHGMLGVSIGNVYWRQEQANWQSMT